jgi:hypothetical protein
MFKGIGNILYDAISNTLGSNGPIVSSSGGKPPLPPEYVYWVSQSGDYMITQEGDNIILDIIYN